MNYYSLLLILSQSLQKEILKKTKKTNQESPEKSTIDIPKPERFSPTEEIQKYKQLMAILKPYHNHKKYSLRLLKL